MWSMAFRAWRYGTVVRSLRGVKGQDYTGRVGGDRGSTLRTCCGVVQSNPNPKPDPNPNPLIREKRTRDFVHCRATNCIISAFASGLCTVAAVKTKIKWDGMVITCTCMYMLWVVRTLRQQNGKVDRAHNLLTGCVGLRIDADGMAWGERSLGGGVVIP